jgi:myo-inositol-1(or 4)-monophosphatase
MTELFEAAKGTGAFLNSNPIAVSGTSNLEDALLATGFPYDIQERADEVLNRFRKMLVASQGVRRPGSAALDMCYVAAGRLDGFWEQGLKPWDTAAGMIIIQEAGGKLSTFLGEHYTPYQNSVVAGNPSIHKAMLTAMNS